MNKVVNKKAYFDFTIGDTFEAGIVLTGEEVKAIRAGKMQLTDSFVLIRNGEAVLMNAFIGHYSQGRGDFDPRRDRKLLLNRKEIEYLNGKVSGANLTIVPLSLNFKHNFAKITIALAAGKKKYDKREALKKREQEKEARTFLRRDKLKHQRENS